MDMDDMDVSFKIIKIAYRAFSIGPGTVKSAGAVTSKYMNSPEVK